MATFERTGPLKLERQLDGSATEAFDCGAAACVMALDDAKKVSPNRMVHLTEKPVELARRAIEYSSLAGEVVRHYRAHATSRTQEVRMTTIIERHRADIEALCRSYRVKRLDVFGSAIREDFDPGRSDVDFLVEFERDPGRDTFRAYMGLRDGLSRGDDGDPDAPHWEPPSPHRGAITSGPPAPVTV